MSRPSPHTGGELVIRHADREATIDLSGDEVAELKFAAFYADCEHEVLPTTRGNRVCLVYNLLQRPPRDAKNACAAIAANAKAFDPRTSAVPALRKLHDQGGSVIGNADYQCLWLHTADVLLTRSEYPPSPPRDWRQDTRLPVIARMRQTHRFRVNKDRRLSAAITAMHEKPGFAWTLRELAKRAGMSRSAFALRFKERMGTSAMGYLTRWRMLLAADRRITGE